ncbi:putative RNA methyltransferase [Polycyclovorans algicola]|uniref:putative RNA methyltransferase n=1 Tax=Polycyclovorans algicola TaxID=616992 RepID=UPI0004A6E499|nr:methyltransferase domain-containing protein [Polycyclovorans algicola]
MSVICPLCRLPLAREPKAWRCEQGHSFDVAREGYVNLLPVQQKKSRDPGDDVRMVHARRAFLQAGHYRPLRDAVLAMLAPLKATRVLDIGCGEGDYTGAFPAVAGEVIGLDIARPAIRLAAKRYPAITWLVGSGAHLPLADASVDGVTNLFTQLHVAEMRRVLRPGGHVLVVTPAARHLWTLREQLFDVVQAHAPDKFRVGFETDFEAVTQQTVSVPLQLSQADLQHLLLMTPYAWKARPERREAMNAFAAFETEAAFSLLLFKRKPQ